MDAPWLIKFEPINNEVAYANHNINTVWHPNSVREVRFQLSLQDATFVECMRVRFDCPFGIRIQLKKRILSQCRKVKKWFKRLPKPISGKEENLPTVPSCFSMGFGSSHRNLSIEDHACNIFSASNPSHDSILTSEGFDTVIHSPNRLPLFYPARAKLNKYA